MNHLEATPLTPLETKPKPATASSLTIDARVEGTCPGHNGPGTWAAILTWKNNRQELSGAQDFTTNNQVVLMAILEAVKAVTQPCVLRVHTNSANAIGWLTGGWKRKDPAVATLCRKIDSAVAMRDIKLELVKVKGRVAEIAAPRQPTMALASPATATEGLNAEQRHAFDELYLQLRLRAQKYLSLIGPAGTGKTFLAGRIAHALLCDECPVKLCAPTHQAAAVLLRKMGNLAEGVEPTTVHSLLGLRLTRDGNGGYRLTSQRKNRKYRYGDIIICDEASMIGANLWRYIEDVSEVTWLFLGDEAQLPPVNEDPSPALRVPGVQLTEIVRQARGNPIVELGRRIREGERALTPDVLRYQQDGGIAIARDRQAMLDSAQRLFANPERDPYQGRILAFRNKVVNAYNHDMRQRLYGNDAAPYAIGEWLVAHDTFFHPERKTPVIKNSQMLRVIHARQKKTEAKGGTWLVWDLRVAVADEEGQRHITVIDPSEAERYDEALRGKAELASTARREGRESWPLWEAYYEMREQFAQVRYGYAQTVHKAQGSTFETAFVDWRDLQAASSDMKQALQYVAVTRPSHRLALLR